MKGNHNPFLHLFMTAKPHSILYLIFSNRIKPQKFVGVILWLFLSLLGYPFMLAQKLMFTHRIKKISFERNPPVFIIGYFRSGTTHLHNLMSKDDQFGVPDNYHGLLINYCLIGGEWLKRQLGKLMPSHRIQDNVFVSMDEPQEEEQAMFCYTRHSGFVHYFFPKNPSYFNKYVLLNSGNRVNAIWKKKYLELLQIISYSIGTRNLLLKNPLNTSRIKVIRNLFPRSKYIFIIRNPYDMYSSLLHWHKTLIGPLSLQNLSALELEELILMRFKSIVLKYLEFRDCLSGDCLTEVKFENLENDPSKAMRHIYKDLSLEGFDEVMPKINEYLTSIHGYQKNSYPSLSTRVIERINEEWSFVFKEWKYEILKS